MNTFDIFLKYSITWVLTVHHFTRNLWACRLQKAQRSLSSQINISLIHSSQHTISNHCGYYPTHIFSTEFVKLFNNSKEEVISRETTFQSSSLKTLRQYSMLHLTDNIGNLYNTIWIWRSSLGYEIHR